MRFYQAMTFTHSRYLHTFYTMKKDCDPLTKLKKLRLAHGYTQDFVASHLGIARQTYSHYETGRRMPPYDVMRHLADFYGVSLDELKEIAPTDPDSRQKYRLLSRSEKDLVFYFNQIPDNYKWELVEIAKVLARKPK